MTARVKDGRTSAPRTTKRRLLSAVAAFALLPALVAPTAWAAEADQVTNVAVRQDTGFATLSWTHVDGAAEYEISRTATDASGNPTGPQVTVGIWRPGRQINQDKPTFADAGFAPGDSFQWQVRAVIDGEAQPWSEPIAGTTLPPWGDPGVAGENLRTQWELTKGAQYTPDTDEYAYTEAIDELSDRVRVVELGRTHQGRPINMFVIGYPAPPATAEEVAKTSPAVINCNVHGNEPGDREACLIMARQLAFGDDERTIDLLSNTTVLIVPTINGDGRARNTRGNLSGQDLNRDYSLLRQPETQAYVEMMRDYRPVAGYDGHEYGNSRAGDLPMMAPRHLNVSQGIFDESMDMIENHMYVEGAEDGWWPCPYGCVGGTTVGMSEETILRNTAGLKNTVNSLLELRSSGGPTRPNEGNTSANRQRKTFSALWTFNEFLDYHRAQVTDIEEVREEAVTFQASNTGRIVFRGSRDIPKFPAPHPGEDGTRDDPPAENMILELAPCAYKLTEEQYTGARTDGYQGVGTTVKERLASHGWKVIAADGAYYVPLAQPERGLVPLLLDGQAVEDMVAGERIYPETTKRFNGGLKVSGFMCLEDAEVNGGTVVEAGGALVATGTSFNGGVRANGAAGVVLGNSTAKGGVSVAGTDGPVSVIGTSVSGGLRVNNNTDATPVFVAGNSVKGGLSCSGNSGVTDYQVPSDIKGGANGQCAGL